MKFNRYRTSPLCSFFGMPNTFVIEDVTERKRIANDLLPSKPALRRAKRAAATSLTSSLTLELRHGLTGKGGELVSVDTSGGRLGPRTSLSDSTRAKPIGLVVALLLPAIVSLSWSQSPTAKPKTSSPDLNAILQSLERAEQQNLAHSHPYGVTRQYKTFRGDDKQPTAEVTAQIRFTPPNSKTFKIIQASGQPRGEKIVRDMLEQETDSSGARSQSRH
jgi:hypothetical protein